MTFAFWTHSWLVEPNLSLPQLAIEKVVKNAIRIYW